MDTIVINENLCQARRSQKGAGLNEQCPNKKKIGSNYCGKHTNCTNPFSNILNLSKDICSKTEISKELPIVKDIEETSPVKRTETRDKKCEYQNKTEFFTLEDISEIPSEFFLEYREGDKIFAFDIRTLHDYIQSCNPLEDIKNPYTNVAISKEKLDDIKKRYKKMSKSKTIDDYKDKIEFTPEKKLEWRVLEVFQKINNLGHYSDYKWFWDLNLVELKKYYYELEDLWNYRLFLNYHQKQKILPNYTPFVIYNIAIFNKINKLDDARKILIDEIDKFISMGITEGKNGNDNKYTGSIIVLTALVEVSLMARQGLPHLVPIVD